MTGAIDSATWWLFVGAVLVLLVSPGPNMVFILSHGIAFGARGGIAAAAGIGCADLMMTLLTATGVTAMVAAWPASFDVLRYAGTAYLLYIAFKAIQPKPHGHARSTPLEPSTLKVFVKAIGGSLINPKPMLFFVVFLPQFVNPQHGAVTSQLAVLGLTLALLAFAFHATLGLFAGHVARNVQPLLQRYPQAATLQRWGLAATMIGLAAYLLFTEHAVKNPA